MTVDFLDRDWEHCLERRHKLLPSLSDKHFTLFDHEGWLDVIVVERRHLNLDSFDSVAADEAHLGGLRLVSIHIDGCLGQLKAQ